MRQIIFSRSTIITTATFGKYLEKWWQAVQGQLAYFTYDYNNNNPDQLHPCSISLSVNYLEFHIHNPNTWFH